MAAKAKEAWFILKKTYEGFSEDECMSMGAALAFYTMFSLPPILVIMITVIGAVWQGSSNTEDALMREIRNQVGPQAAEQIDTIFERQQKGNGGTFATVLSAVALVFGATGVMAQLQLALDKAWDVAPDPEKGGVKNFVIKRALSFVMILVLTFLLLISLLLSTFLSTFNTAISNWAGTAFAGPLLMVVNFLVSFLILVGFFAAIFKVLPDAETAWRDVWIGAAVTAALFVIGKFLISLYLGYASVASPYGTAGSLVLLLMWVYYSALIMLAGAEFTQVWARRHGMQIKPSPGAIRTNRQGKSAGESKANPREKK